MNRFPVIEHVGVEDAKYIPIHQSTCSDKDTSDLRSAGLFSEALLEMPQFLEPLNGADTVSRINLDLCGNVCSSLPFSSLDMLPSKGICPIYRPFTNEGF